MSLDTLILAKLAGLKHGFYEVGDIRFNRSNSSIVSFLESFLIKNIKAIIVTSPGFIELFRSQTKKNTTFIVIENKVDLSLERPRFNHLEEEYRETGKIKIGLIGFLRYELPILRIIEFVKENSHKYELHCWGDGPYKNLIKENISDSIVYYGSFKNPDQLEKIYNSIDINYVVYGGEEKTELGVSLAIPNKYYESIFYHVPIISRDNTYLGQLIKQSGIGFEVNINYQNEFDLTLSSINRQSLYEKKIQCSQVDISSIIEDGGEIIKDLIGHTPN